MNARGTGSKPLSLLMFLVVSAVAGVLVAGMALPATALAIGLTKTGASSLKHLPADLAVPPQLQASTMYLSDGSVLATFYDQNRQYVTLDQIAPVMQQAQVAIEDHRFFEHGALDLQGVVRAALGNAASGGVSGGGSTLTQQYVKLVRQQTCGQDQECIKDVTAPKLERKILEMRYAVAMEQELPKEQILERYLNIAYYGDGAYGVQAAARHYFNVDAKDLSLAQASMLAGLVQNPGQVDPVNNLDAAMNRRREVLNAMVTYQGMDPEQAKAAGAEPFDASKVVEHESGCRGTRYPFICDYASRILLSDQMPSLGATPAERLKQLQSNGLSITLTIDPRIQDAAQNAVSSVVGPEDLAVAVADTVNANTGEVLAMAQSRPVMGDGPGETWFNYSVEYNYGGQGGFMFGSAFKPWTAAAAIEQGKYPDTTYYNFPKKVDWNGKFLKNCEGEAVKLGEPYPTENAVAGHDSGNFNMTDAMMWSVNNYWVGLEMDTSPCAAASIAERAGVKLAHPVANDIGFGDELKDWGTIPSFTLGAPFVTNLSMATGYATFANRGVRCNPVIMKSVKTGEGADVAIPSANCEQTIDPKVADGVNYVLKATHERGLSASAYIPNGIDQASKTGTADDSAAALAFVGYSPNVATSVIIAGDNEKPEWRATPEKDRRIYTIYMTPLGRQLGSTDGRSIWKPLMTAAMEGMPQARFEPWIAPRDSKTTYNGDTTAPQQPQQPTKRATQAAPQQSEPAAPATTATQEPAPAETTAAAPTTEAAPATTEPAPADNSAAVGTPVR